MHTDEEGAPVLHPNEARKAITTFKQPTYTIVNCAEKPDEHAWTLFLWDGKDGARVSLIDGLDPVLYWVLKWLHDNCMPVVGIEIVLEPAYVGWLTEEILTMTSSEKSKIDAAIVAHGENFHFEYRAVGSDLWHRSPHLARPLDEAEALVARMNAADDSIEYRYVPWDGE